MEILRSVVQGASIGRSARRLQMRLLSVLALVAGPALAQDVVAS
jgi:hypothetical protein